MALCEMTNYDDYSVKWMRNGSREISDENLAIYPARASASSRNWFDYRPRMRSALHHRERDCACPVSYIIGNETAHAQWATSSGTRLSMRVAISQRMLLNQTYLAAHLRFIQLPSFSFLGVGCLPGWPPSCLLACLERTWIEDPQRAG